MRMDPKSMAVKAAVYFSLLLVTIILVAILVPNMGSNTMVPGVVEGLPEESGLILQPLSGSAAESVPAELAPETAAPMDAEVPAEQEGVH